MRQAVGDMAHGTLAQLGVQGNACLPLAEALAMTSATAAISRSPFFQSATRALAVVRAGSARAPDVQTAASGTAAAIKVRPMRLRMLADYEAMDSIDKGSAMWSWLRNRRERVKRRR